MTIALDLTRTFDASPARVFACFINAAEMGAWLGPFDHRGEVLELEARIGGRFRIVMHKPDGTDLFAGGVFQTIEEPHRIAYTWKWEDGEADTLIIVTLRDVGGKTEMHFRHEGFSDETYRDRHIPGWTSCLDKMETYLTTGIRQDKAA
jgi:uncharacterized protein YndB with AHSA1/START domain